MEVTMKRWMIALCTGAALAGSAAALAAGEDASLDKRLADAQRRLEDAAREVAELSGEAAGPGAFRQFEYFLPGARRAMLGVNLGASESNGGGVRVEGVSPGGPAAEAGVKPGDVIVAVQAKPVTTGRELVRAMEAVEPGEKVELGLKRDGKPVKLAVEARPLDRTFFVGTPGVPAVRPLPPLPALSAVEAMPMDGDLHWLLEDWGDAEFVTLTPGLGHYFGADKGVLVAHAPEDASLGLKDGDVIVAIGGREPQNGRHAMRILRSYQPGETVDLRILRDRKTQTLSAKIPEREARDVMLRHAAPPRPPAPAAPVAPPPSENDSTT
jgi:hypothetical protein